MRLNVFLQKAGVGSRREAERMVADGRVTVNGAPATITTPVEMTDAVTVDGKAVSVDTKPIPRIFMLHKPVDYLVTTYDSQGRKTIYEMPVLTPPLWNASMPRVMNVGRLDVNSEGLLLLSSDGPTAQAMMQPSTALERIYQVRVRGQLTPDDIRQLDEGVTVNDISYRSVKVTPARTPTGANSWYQVILTEGKNREIRKLMEHFGCIVNRLIRVKYGPFSLGELPLGQIREIPEKQVEALIADLRERGCKL